VINVCEYFALLQNPCTLHLTDIPSNIRTADIFLIVNLQKCLHTEYEVTFMNYLHIYLAPMVHQLLSSNGKLNMSVDFA
jgi:hypothetical protein